ncbi:MAG: universal stress protein [Chlamydiia bacterium]|nr:universal stress protein [Chlamydiia bacterium]MCP5509894.1 universal stress protein [Chlamydiales bacterium]
MRQKIAQIDKGAMRRVLGIRELFAVGYGDLGSSIYYALGITALYALGATPIALALAGLVFACTALTYAEMSSMTRDSGGSASYTRRAFNDLVSFIAGWGLLLDFIVTIAISSYAVSSYLAYFFPLLKLVQWKIFFTVVLIGSLGYLNVRGVKHSVKLSSVLTSLTVITQGIIIVVGALTIVSIPDFIEHLKIGISGSSWSPSWSDFMKGCAMAMVAYTGIESMTQLASEAKNPSKTVPKAIMYAMGTLIAMYLGVSIVALSALSPQDLSTTYIDDPIAGIVTAMPFGGKILAPWIGLLGSVILVVAANAGLIGASRLSFNMGEHYQLPRFLHQLHSKFRTPAIALSVFALLASLIVIASRGKLSFLADLYNFGAMLAFCSAHLSLIMLRIKEPRCVRPFKVPLNIRFKNKELPITALFGGVITFAVWVLVVITKPEGRYLGFAWLAVGLVMYFSLRKTHQIKPAGHVTIEKISIPDFKPLTIKKILVPIRGGVETEIVQAACQLAKVHKAEVVIATVIEMPFSISLDAPLPKRLGNVEHMLKKAEAVGREFGVPVKLELLRSRSAAGAILELIDEEKFDLVVMGVGPRSKPISSVIDEVLHEANCRVWVMSPKR